MVSHAELGFCPPARLDACSVSQLRLNYQTKVPVNSVVRIRGPEATAGGFNIHVWVRDGRQSRHHTVSTRTLQEAQEWVAGVQNAKDLSSSAAAAPELDISNIEQPLETSKDDGF